jgi:hypothetical protein
MMSEEQLSNLLHASAAQGVAATAAVVSASTAPLGAPYAAIKTPYETYAALADDGTKHCAGIPLLKLLLLSVYAGVYIGFGGFVATSVVNLLPGGQSAYGLSCVALQLLGLSARVSLAPSKGAVCCD